MHRLRIDSEDDLRALVPAKGTRRSLTDSRGGWLVYPAGVQPARGPVAVCHLPDGRLRLEVRPSRCPPSEPAVERLFRRGWIDAADCRELKELMMTVLRACGPGNRATEPSSGRREPAGLLPPVRAADDALGVRPLLTEPEDVRRLRARSFSSPETIQDKLRARVAGQDDALLRLAAGVALHLRKVAPAAPYSAMLLGPTGVGKTETTIALHEALLADRGTWQRVQIDCGEITGTDQLNRVIGAAPGYVGFGDGSPLTRAFDEGNAVVVFDEVEKAHPALLQRVLLGLLDRGRVSSPHRGVDACSANARRSIILFTSNLVTSDSSCAPGFEAMTADVGLRRHLRRGGLAPELVGRITDVIALRRLDHHDTVRTAEMIIHETVGQFGLRASSIDPVFIARALDLADEEAGARGLQVAVERLLSAAILAHLDRGESALMAVALGRERAGDRSEG